MHVLLLSSDLMLVSSVDGVARRHGAKLTTIGSLAQLAEFAVDEGPLVAALDLRLPQLDLPETVAALRKVGVAYILAGGPHVLEQLLAAASEAGCDETVARGQFEMRLDAALGRLSRSSSP
jgi:DNA-binding response OmpR family regulator